MPRMQLFFTFTSFKQPERLIQEDQIYLMNTKSVIKNKTAQHFLKFTQIFVVTSWSHRRLSPSSLCLPSVCPRSICSPHSLPAWLVLRPRLRSVASGMQDYLNLGIHRAATKQSPKPPTVRVHQCQRIGGSAACLSCCLSLNDTEPRMSAYACNLSYFTFPLFSVCVCVCVGSAGKCMWAALPNNKAKSFWPLPWTCPLQYATRKMFTLEKMWLYTKIVWGLFIKRDNKIKGLSLEVNLIKKKPRWPRISGN